MRLVMRPAVRQLVSVTHSDRSKKAPGMTLHIRGPWTMPVDWCAVEDGIRERLGRHPLAKKKFSVVAISNDPYGAIVDVEADGRFAVVYYWQQKGKRWVEKPRVVFLPDVQAVQARIDEDDRAWCEKYRDRGWS